VARRRRADAHPHPPPDIAEPFGIADPYDPRETIMGGTRLLAELLGFHHHNIPLVLAASTPVRRRSPATAMFRRFERRGDT
jgi:hypothetical protein